jgi:hypothetical protein
MTPPAKSISAGSNVASALRVQDGFSGDGALWDPPIKENEMKRSTTRTLTAAIASISGIFAAAGAMSGPATSAPTVTAGRGGFDHPQQNRYFPVVPGTISRYRGAEDGEISHERVVVTHRSRTIEGVKTTVVSDILRRADGSLEEKTLDWYAPDNDGNVWYYGEATATYDEAGHVESREGSWEAGVDGAVAGVIMPANPHPTDAYRQEYYPRHAEDQAWIVQRKTSTTVPYGTLHHVVRSFEWTRLEKKVVSLKFYAPGLGIVREKDLSGGDESFVLVSVRHR